MIENLKLSPPWRDPAAAGKIENSRKGFTLIEIMVVIAIIGILASIALVNSGKNPDRDARLEKDRLVTYLRDLENKSLAASTVSGSGASEKICGFGFYVKSDTQIQTYYLQSGLDGDCSAMDIKNPGGQDIDTFTLEHSLKFKSYASDAYVAFMIPSGNVSAGGTAVLPQSIYIVDGGETITPIQTTITETGLIQ